MELKAELMPLEGKYYGTEIVLSSKYGKGYMKVWINGVGDYTPSKRELEGHDEAEYGPYEICDDHFESDAAHKICEAIVEALNGKEL